MPTPAGDFIAGLVDDGAWRERATHWHLVAFEAPIFIGGKLNEQTRFNRGHSEDLHRQTREFAWTPHEALTWLADGWARAFADSRRTPDPLAMAVRRGWRTENDWHSWLETCFESLTNGWGRPVGGGVALRENHSLDLFAEPVQGVCAYHSMRRQGVAHLAHPVTRPVV